MFTGVKRESRFSGKQVTPENFKSDLKNLAKGLKQFEQSLPSGPINSSLSPTVQIEFENFQSGGMEPPPKSEKLELPPPNKIASNHVAPTDIRSTDIKPTDKVASKPSTLRSLVSKKNQEPLSETNTPPLTASQPPIQELDSKTLEILTEVKKNLNLSQDYEVIRMLVALGYERVKQLFPPNS